MKSKGKEGKQFEHDFKNSVPEYAYYYRIKDTANSWAKPDQMNSNIRFTPKNEFDAILYSHPVLCVLELKSTKGTSFSFMGKTPMIKSHQIEELEKAVKIDGIFSGFVFNFREPEDTYFLGINEFITFKNLTTKVSINKNDIITCGGVKINAELKRTRYKYDIDGFLQLCCDYTNSKEEGA
jgi:penicillin-binding protein-related factor A (putative recombinase)